ncbi:MAG: histidine kinase N-terminal 7TM domain-containing protein [Gemmatimonadota bacterium]
MTWQYTPYTFPLLLAAVASLGLAGFVWRRRPGTRGALCFVGIQVAAAVWSTSSALDLASVGLADKLLWIRLQYLGVVAIPALWLIFALRYTGHERWLRPRHLALLAIEPAATHLVLWGGGLDGLMYREAIMHSWRGCQVLTVVYGPWFWLHAAYSYGLLLAGAAVLVPWAWRSPHLYRSQLASVLAGALAPWLANAVYILRLSPFDHLDLTPFGFIAMGMALTWGLFRHRLLDMVPVAWHTVVERLDDGVLVIGRNGRIADANRAAQRLLGRSADALLGRLPEEALAHRPELLALWGRGVADRAEMVLGEAATPRTCDVDLLPLAGRQREVQGQILVLHDITARKQLEAAVVRAQRLRAAAELSLGLSHNLNNLLTGVLGPARLLQRSRSGDPQSARHLETILTAATRARDLVWRLGRTVRPEAEGEPEPVDVAAAVEEAVQGSRPRWQDEAAAAGARIEVSTSAAAVPPVRATRSGLHDVLLNLIFNAVDAMPGGGAIAIRARAVAGQVELAVADTGTGMDEDTRQRLFEPFFTTKTDVGTGLGLATAYATVVRWGGAIEVSSAPGAGATFTLRLPVWDGPLPVPSVPGPGRAAPGGAAPPVAPARIMLVEDDAITSMVLVESLREDGHRVIACASGAQALREFRPDAFDLVVADLGMPDLHGDELVSRLRARDPGLLAGLLTGWHLGSDDPRLASFSFYLQKPVAPEELQQAVRQVLAGRRGGSTPAGGAPPPGE